MKILALRNQIGRLPALRQRPKLTLSDRFLWAWLSSLWNGWKSRVSIFKPIAKHSARSGRYFVMAYNNDRTTEVWSDDGVPHLLTECGRVREGCLVR